jgi:hypothetical protein
LLSTLSLLRFSIYSVKSILTKVLPYSIAIALIFFTGAGCTTAQQTSNTQSTSGLTSTPPTSTPKKQIRPYTEIITTDAKSDSGLFTVHRIDEKLFFEIPKRHLGKQMLLVSRMAKTPQIGYGGEEANTEVIRWERKFDRILLRAESFINVAADTLPIARAVKASNFEEIIASLPIQAISKDSSNIVVDVTSLFTTDIGILTPKKELRDQYRITSLSADRSLIDFARSYPMNIEIENILTYSAENAPQNPSSRTATFTMHHSMVLLPEKPMTPRLTDWRVGFFSTYKTDYGLDVQRAERRGYILRYRLEPKDSTAYFKGILTEPVKPITYYIDPATPIKWRPWLRKGIESWNVAFEQAGFKNAVRVLDPPDPSVDPEFSPEDVRYSVIRYFSSPIENAYGPNIHDPRSGEILESDIGWYHNIMNLQTGWYFTQAVADPRAHKLPFPDSLMGELIAMVAAHEFGHTIGFPHNMKASSSYPIDSLRSPTFTKEYGTAPSIMDYARYNYVAQPEDGAYLMPKVGPYDKYAVNWGYRVYPSIKVPEDETPMLNKLIRLQDTNPMLRYGRQQLIVVDPSAQTEDLGDDAIKATKLGIKNLERVMGYLIPATTEDDKDYSLLSEMYGKTIAQWRREVEHVAEHIGGVVGVYKNSGQSGDVYSMIAREKQKDCLKFLAEYVFTTPVMFLRPDILRLIEPSGSSERVMRNQERILSTVLQNDKLLRLLEYNSSDSKQYAPEELLNDVEGYLFPQAGGSGSAKSATTSKPIEDVYTRNLQRSYVSNLISKIQPPVMSTSVTGGISLASFGMPSIYRTDIRGIVRNQLVVLGQKLKKITTANTVQRAHYTDLLSMIDEALNPKK